MAKVVGKKKIAKKDGVPSAKTTNVEPSCISLTTFFWVFPYLIRGYFLNLDSTSMPSIFQRLGSKANCEVALEKINEKMKKNQFTSIKSVVFQHSRTHLVLGIIISVAQGILNNFGRPLVLKLVIDAAMPESNLTEQEVIPVVILFGIVIFLEGICTVQVRQILSSEYCSTLVSWLVPVIHQKSMRIAGNSSALYGNTSKISKKNVKEGPTSNNESSIIGNDIIRGFEELKWTCGIVQHSVGLIAGVVALFFLLGWNCLIGIAVMILVLSLNLQIAKCSEKVTKKELEATDSRMSTMKEVIDGIQQVKFGGLEENYLSLLSSKRAHEIGFTLKARLFQICNVTLGRGCPIIAGCMTFVFMGLQNVPLHPASVFASLAAYNSLRMALIVIPMNLIQVFTLNITAGRISTYLNLPEQQHTNILDKNSDNIVQIENATVGWGEKTDKNTRKRARSTSNDDTDGNKEGRSHSIEEMERFTLSKMNFNVPRDGSNGFLIAVVGQVGSGKSTFISSLIGSSTLDSGKILTVKEIGYVPQKAFVMSGTILDNILMGREKNNDYLDEAIESSAFRTDLKLMSGLNTEVGERGTTLSGGQQQRLAIARAVYGDPELLIVDDALAAVDGHVANTIFEKSFIKRRKKGLTTIVSINQLHFLPQFDHILYLNGNKIQHAGTYDEVFNASQEFRDLVLSGEAAADQDLDNVENKDATKDNKKDRNNISDAINKGDIAESAKSIREEGEKKKKVELVKKENVKKGFVSGKEVLLPYYNALGGNFYIVIVMILALSAYSLMATNDLWLASWVTDISNLSQEQNTSRAVGYIAISFSQFLGVLFLSAFNSFRTTKAGRIIHDRTITHVLHAPMRWYESTPSGRILSRFSGDLSLVDHHFSFIVDDICHFCCIILAFLVVIGMIVPQIIPVLFCSMILYGFQVVAVDRTNREVKRATNTALGPVMTLVQETVNSKSLIHAMGFEAYFSNRMYSLMDEWTRFNYFSCSVINAGYTLVNFLAFVISVSSASIVLFNRETFQNPAMVGVALGYSFLLPYFLGLFSMLCQMGLVSATSLERVLQYQSDEVPCDPAWYLPGDEDLEKMQWPTNGNVKYVDMSLRYRPNLPPAINNVTLEISGGENVGVIGRTGAGKSTLMVALFRLVDPCHGNILIDGVDIQKVGLQNLRKKIAIIPQRSLILEGTIRHNLDPFSKYQDNQLKQILVDVNLCKNLRGAEKLLRVNIGPNSNSLSAGEQQLLSIGRALLKKDVRIVIMDEPTANIDMRTDEMVQEVIRKAFSESTVITIAHRLNTIIDYDKIIVMDTGKVVEIGKPVNLLDDTNGFLHHMVKSMGSEAASGLRQKAIEAANAKKMHADSRNNNNVEMEENDGSNTTEVRINMP
jgi:ATP-binding cassette, subfamily C (CFTR/MRP), member 1